LPFHVHPLTIPAPLLLLSDRRHMRGPNNTTAPLWILGPLCLDPFVPSPQPNRLRSEICPAITLFSFSIHYDGHWSFTDQHVIRARSIPNSSNLSMRTDMPSFMPSMSLPLKRTKQSLPSPPRTMRTRSRRWCKFTFEFSNAYFVNDVLRRIYACQKEVSYSDDFVSERAIGMRRI
jgi:hypothetical protein